MYNYKNVTGKKVYVGKGCFKIGPRKGKSHKFCRINDCILHNKLAYVLLIFVKLQN